MTSYYRDPRAPAPNVPRRVGVAAAMERDGSFLVERRADNDEAHEWAFVGGNLGEEESVLDALHREVREETGFAIAEAELFGVLSDPTRIVEYPDGNVCRLVTIAFRVVPLGAGEPVPSSESAEMRFVAATELGALPIWAVHQPLRDALLSTPTTPVVA